MKRKITITIIIACVAIIILWDIFVAVTGRNIFERADTTVSGITLGWAQQHPALPFSLGGLVGHLLWPLKAATYRVLRVLALAAMALAWLVVDIWVDFAVNAILIFIPGVGLGHFLWPQIDLPPKPPEEPKPKAPETLT